MNRGGATALVVLASVLLVFRVADPLNRVR